jgi:hypothetical protein
MIAGCGGQNAPRIDRVAPTLDAASEMPAAAPDAAGEPEWPVVDAGVDTPGDSFPDNATPPLDTRAETGVDAAGENDSADAYGSPDTTDADVQETGPDGGADADASHDVPHEPPRAPDGALICPALPRPNGTPLTEGVHCCGGITCAPQGFACGDTDCGCHLVSRPVLFNDNAFSQGGLGRGVYWLLEGYPSSACVAIFHVGIAGQTGCIRMMTSGGRDIRDPLGANRGTCYSQSFTNSAATTLSIELTQNTGATTDWTILQSVPLSPGGACPITCP